MRRTDRQISAPEIEEILQKGNYGVLSAVDPEGWPYAVPLSYAWKDGLLYFHCAQGVGKKVEALGACPRVSFVVVGDTCVQPRQFTTLYESVIVRGEAQIAGDKRAGLTALLEKYSAAHMEKGLRYLEAMADKTGVYAITPREITGKAKRASKSDE